MQYIEGVIRPAPGPERHVEGDDPINLLHHRTFGVRMYDVS